MTIKTIFLDLDDVLNDFTMPALRHVGCELEAYDPAWGFDIVEAFNATCASYLDCIFDHDSFWSKFSWDFWAGLPKSEMCDWLIEECVRRVGQDNVCILTRPTDEPSCLAGKLDWIHANLPQWLHRQYLIGEQKYHCARPDTLLIDDSDENVDAFRDAGGQGLLVPRPWNCLHVLGEPSGWIKDQLNGSFKGGLND